MKCHACGFIDPDPLDNSPSPRFAEIKISGNPDPVFKIQEYREAADIAPNYSWGAGWWGHGPTRIFACPECGTLRTEK